MEKLEKAIQQINLEQDRYLSSLDRLTEEKEEAKNLYEKAFEEKETAWKVKENAWKAMEEKSKEYNEFNDAWKEAKLSWEKVNFNCKMAGKKYYEALSAHQALLLESQEEEDDCLEKKDPEPNEEQPSKIVKKVQFPDSKSTHWKVKI